MSRAFVKDDAPGEPPIVPPRASLPDGVPNYVTPRGMLLLREERSTLEVERSTIHGMKLDDAERQRQLVVIAGRLAELAQRISSARVVRPLDKQPTAVRFGTLVTTRSNAGIEKTIQIVGVDEANVNEDRIAFVAPIANALIGRHIGDSVELQTPAGMETLVITAISYETQRKN